MLLTFCSRFIFSLSVQSRAFDCPEHTKPSARPVLHDFRHHASVSWLLEKDSTAGREVLLAGSYHWQSGQRICEVGKGAVGVRSLWENSNLQRSQAI